MTNSRDCFPLDAAIDIGMPLGAFPGGVIRLRSWLMQRQSARPGRTISIGFEDSDYDEWDTRAPLPRICVRITRN